MHQEEDNGGFWPGYVAAVACLVLSLLLISAVMSITIMQLGVSVGQMVDAQIAAQMAAAAEQTPPADVPPPPAQANLPSLELMFPPDAWRLDDAARKRLLAEIDRLMKRGVKEWTVSLQTDTNDSLRRRAAYLQLLAVRSVMLEAGVLGSQIELRMLEVNPEQATQAQYPLKIIPKAVSVDGAREAPGAAK